MLQCLDLTIEDGATPLQPFLDHVTFRLRSLGERLTASPRAVAVVARPTGGMGWLYTDASEAQWHEWCRNHGLPFAEVYDEFMEHLQAELRALHQQFPERILTGEVGLSWVANVSISEGINFNRGIVRHFTWER